MTLSRNLADALCYDQVRVNHFNVGWVLTPNEYEYKVADGLPPDWPDKIPKQYAPSGRIMARRKLPRRPYIGSRMKVGRSAGA